MVSQTVVTCIFLILFTQLAGLNTILSDIQVLENRVIVNFPETIDYVLNLESESTVEGATLVYGTNAASCSNGGSRQSQDFDPGKKVEVEWQWDLKRSGALPPGAEIWWQWEIEDDDGNIVLTDRQSVTVADDRHRWQEISDANVTLHWYDGDNSFGRSLLAIAVDSLERLNDEAGITTSNPVQLWIYPSAADVRDAVVNSADWTGGVAFPAYGITVIGLRPGEEERAAKIIPHELAHLVEGIVIFNCRGGRLPTWLSEGLAEFSSDGRSESDLAELQNQLEEGQLPPLHFLSRGFSAYAADASLAYTQSAQVVSYLLEVYGPENMAKLLTQIKSGQAIDDALETTYGFDTSGLDAAWRTSLGYAPTPTSPADSAMRKATPTQIPTLALAGIPVSNAPTFSAATPAMPTETFTPTVTETAVPPLSTETRTPIAVAAVIITETAPATAVPSNSSPEESSSVSPLLLFAAAGFIVVIGLILFLLFRGDNTRRGA